MQKYDVIIIGSGVAALNCAISLPLDLDVLLITKDTKRGANSYWAQGGIAVALDANDVNAHINDTIEAGANRNDPKAVEILSSRSREIIDSLIALGMDFDKTKEGELHYTKEGAHSTNRIIHAGGDATGKELNTFLASKNNHKVEIGAVTDLLIKGSVCYGVTIFKDGEFKNTYADHVVIASGGLGGLYEYSTNASGIDANLQGIAITKGIALRDMHMLQFHPTVFVKGQDRKKFLLSEALRGEGAKLIDEDFNNFMSQYDERLELAPRDVISRSIFTHTSKLGKEVFLDLSVFDEGFFEKRFPTISSKLIEFGFNPPNQAIPISPAFHYAMGGITTDLNTKVLGITNLYAVGEVASTMVHGANRLASNSLLESLVFGKIAAQNIRSSGFKTNATDFDVDEAVLELKDDALIDDELRKIMWEYAGIVRDPKGLELALQRVNDYLSTKIGKILKLKLLVAKEIIIDAMEHGSSQGAHFIQK